MAHGTHLDAELRLEPAGGRGDVSPLLFGALTEHFGRGIYGGLWDTARNVPRADVTAAVRALGTSMLRYPGGCFSDWYHWRDGVGPRAQRPTYERTYWTDFRSGDASSDDLAREFGPVETNAFGTDEFRQLCVDLGADPMLAANFGTGSPDEAADWVRYCNRESTGLPRVDWWCVGNETYGPWELGHCSAAEYGKGLLAFGEAMHEADPDIKLVAVGHATAAGATASGWNREVLAQAGDHVDALSVHWYFPGTAIGRPLRDDEADYLQVALAPLRLGGMLDAVISEVDEALPGRNLPLALDEWNLWATWEDLVITNRRLCDAVFYAGCFNRLIERADRVRLAMISHLVNCMAPVQTRGDRHFVTSGYLISQLYSSTMRSQSLGVRIDCDSVTAPRFDVSGSQETTLTEVASWDDISGPVVDAVATADERGTTIYITNRSMIDEVHLTISNVPPAPTSKAHFRYLTGDSPFVCNTIDRPDALRWREVDVEVDAAGKAKLAVPPCTAGALLTG